MTDKFELALPDGVPAEESDDYLRAVAEAGGVAFFRIRPEEKEGSIGDEDSASAIESLAGGAETAVENQNAVRDEDYWDQPGMMGA